MLAGIRGLHRKERPRADMQRYLVEGYAALLQACRQRISEMQAGGRCRHRAVRLGKHGLIVEPIPLVGRPPGRDVRRERHDAAFVQRFVEHGPMECEGEDDLAPLAFFLDPRIELAEKTYLALIAEAHDIAGGNPLGRFDEGAPARAIEPLMQRGLDLRLAGATPYAAAAKTRRDDLGIIDDERITRAQQIGEVADMGVGQLQLRSGANDQQPRGIARRDGTQGDTVRRELELEGVGSHALSYTAGHVLRDRSRALVTQG